MPFFAKYISRGCCSVIFLYISKLIQASVQCQSNRWAWISADWRSYSSTHFINKQSRCSLFTSHSGFSAILSCSSSSADLYYPSMSNCLLVLHLKLEGEPVLFKSVPFVDVKFCFLLGSLLYSYCFICCFFDFQLMLHLEKEASPKSVIVWGLTMKWLSWHHDLLPSAPTGH